MEHKRRRAVFRADASSEIGGGHVMRCLTLANCMTAAGWSVSLACTSETLAVVPPLRKNIEVMDHPEAGRLDARGLERHWPEGCDVLIVDHYSLDAAYERSCRPWAKSIVVIDDLADRPHHCDLLVDTTHGRRADDYSALLEADTLVLAGSDYALLRPEFIALRDSALARRSVSRRLRGLVVSFGLTDVGGVTEHVVRALLELGTKVRMDVVVGASASSKAALQKLAASGERFHLHIEPANVAPLLAEADLAVGAGGTSSWERCCLGLPAVLVVLADNQRQVADSLERAKAVVVATAAGSEAIGKAVLTKTRMLLNDDGALRDMACACAAIVDGAGSIRVLTAIQGVVAARRSERNRVKIRACTRHDSALLWTWRNDPLTRANSRRGDVVDWADHEKWFATRFCGPDPLIWMGVVENKEIGVVRFDRSANGGFEVSINLAPECRGRGLGLGLLRAACATLGELVPNALLTATVKEENAVSRKLFESCQFSLVNSDNQFLIYGRKLENADTR